MAEVNTAAEPDGYSVTPPELEKVEQWFWDPDFIRGMVAPLCGIGPGTRVLDVGCGTGGFGRQIYRLTQPNATVVGLDLNSQAVAWGNHYNQAHGYERFTLQQGDARRLGSHFAPATFDATVEVGMLSNVYDPDEVRSTLAQMTGLVRPGGHVASLEIDLRVMMTGESDEMHQLTGQWNQALVRGAAQTRVGNLAIAPQIPLLFHELGLQAIKVKPYFAPEPFAPFSDETIALVVDYRSIFYEDSPAHMAKRGLLRRGGLSVRRIAELCQRLGAYWDERIAIMRQGRMPPLMLQVFLFTCGQRPL